MARHFPQCDPEEPRQMTPEAWFLPMLIVGGVGVVGTVVFGMLWWRARQSLHRRDNSRLDAENRRFDAALTVSELRDRIRLMTEMHD